MIDIDIVCPIYQNSEQVISLFSSFAKQKNVRIKKIIASLTLSHREEDEKIISFFKENKITYFTLEKEKFSHSLTREKLLKEFAEENIVIMLSQDVVFYDENALYHLASAIHDKVIYAFGRQIVRHNCIEKYIREKNYPSKSKLFQKGPEEVITVMDCFSSDAFSAYNREAFIELGGYQNRDLSFNEDQLYSYYVLKNGYQKEYVADAIVYHYHKNNPKQLYQRYYDAGHFYLENEEFSSMKMTNSGFALAKYVLKESLRHFDIVSLFLFLPNMLARYLGLKKGRKQ